jgi:hypothetical protein
LWIIITIIAISGFSAVGAFVLKIKTLFYIFIASFIFIGIIHLINEFKRTFHSKSENAVYPIHRTILDNKSQTFILKPNISYFIQLGISMLCFIYLSVSWLFEGSDYSGFMKIVTILIGFPAVIISTIRFLISPMSVSIDGDNLIVRKCFKGNIIYPLSGVTSVDHAFWISLLLIKSCWLRFDSDGRKILLSFLFYQNMREFLIHLEKRVSGISIDSRLRKHQ